MEHYDSQLAARVWQRVQGSPREDPATDILLSLQEELTDLNRYQQLSDIAGRTLKQELRHLSKVTQQCLSTLRGIYFFLTDTKPETNSSPLSKESTFFALRRAYGSTMQRISRYRHWCDHSEYGPGFVKLTELSHLRCQLLLRLMGNMISS